MSNKKEYYPRANALKRQRRCQARESDWKTLNELTCYKNEPTVEELKDALANAKKTPDGIWHLAALMDNLAAYNAGRYDGNDYHVPGIRAFLSQDPLLKSKYKTLMRYKALAEKIRAIGVTRDSYSHDLPSYNLLWGLSDTRPDDIDEEDDWLIDTWQSLRKLRLSFMGMNFKQIETTINKNKEENHGT